MRILSTLLLVVLCVFVAVTLSTCLFLAVGYAISLVLPLSLFQAALLAVGASLVVVFSLAALLLGWQVPRYVRRSASYDTDDEFDEDEDFDDDEEDEDDDEDDDDFEDAIGEERVFAKSEKLPRNAPCSCGSGLKYKHCCGK